MTPPVLSVRDLHVEIETARGVVRAVDGVSYDVRPGEVVAIVGESGCGKSISSLAVMGLLPPGGRVTRGEVLLGGIDLLAMSNSQLRALRGREMSMVFQEPMTSLNPVLTVGVQVAEPLEIHLGLSGPEARRRTEALLDRVGITDAARRMQQYPHQFSGGMRQRVMIAMALACSPRLLIADEPTTALDVTIQAQILELMRDLCRQEGTALVLITHNLGIVARYADRVNVMYAGRVAERGGAAGVFAAPGHPYTAGLLRAVPRLDRARTGRLATIEGLPPSLASPPPGCRFASRCSLRIDRCVEEPALVPVRADGFAACWRAGDLGTQSTEAAPARTEEAGYQAPPRLEVTGLSKTFELTLPSRHFPFFARRGVRAVSDVSFALQTGETLGLVGESGCGKSTIGRLVLRLETPSAGRILLDGVDVAGLRGAALRGMRRSVQAIFQDPFASLNPRMTVGRILGEPLHVHRIATSHAEVAERVARLLGQVGLPADAAGRYPHELSGGQRQRVGIARALAMEPKLIICDEAVSALDVSVQAQIVNLLEDLQAKLRLTYLFIAHDLAVVRHLARRVAVMYLGRIVELAERDRLYAAPLHPYTRALLSSAPVPDPSVERQRPRQLVAGELPSPLSPPSGCSFRTRCPVAGPECSETPPLTVRADGHLVACHRA